MGTKGRSELPPFHLQIVQVAAQEDVRERHKKYMVVLVCGSGRQAAVLETLATRIEQLTGNVCVLSAPAEQRHLV